MRITHIEWNEETIRHMARHAVEPYEVDEVCFGMSPLVMKSRHNRYYVLGQAESVRYLAIILEYLGKGKAKVITARAMSESERRLYKRR